MISRMQVPDETKMGLEIMRAFLPRHLRSGRKIYGARHLRRKAQALKRKEGDQPIVAQSRLATICRRNLVSCMVDDRSA